MEYNNSIQEDTIFITVFVVAIIVVAAFIYFISVIIPFLKAKKQIEMEMQRSVGEEYDHWERELKRLYRRHIPLIGRFLR